MGKNNDAESRVHTSSVEVGRFRCGSEGCGSSPASPQAQTGREFICLLLPQPKISPFFVSDFSLLCRLLSTDKRSQPLLHPKYFISLSKHRLEQIQRRFNRNKSSVFELKSFRTDAESQDQLCRGGAKRGRRCSTLVFRFLKMKRRRSQPWRRGHRQNQTETNQSRISPSMVKMQSKMATRAWTLTPILRAPALHCVGIRPASHRHDYEEK